MTLIRYFVVLLFLGVQGLHAATLPGFRVETLARADGFVSSVVTDSKGTIYLSTTDGWIHRVDGTQTTRVASVPTKAGGNGGLLGMVLTDDGTAVVHYTTWNEDEGELAKVLDDVVSRVDLATGAELILHEFVCDIETRQHGASSEHHGGNLALGPDGSVFVGIGDYGTNILAQRPEWNAGKIWQVFPNGHAMQWGLGLRNPYDLSWDPELEAVVVGDNGPKAGDEIHVVGRGENCGWPQTYGTHSPAEGANVPVYVFPETVAPTGLLRLNGRVPLLRRGYLLGAFVSRGLYYFPTFSAPPVAVLKDFDEYVIDVTQAPNGDLVFATAAFTGQSAVRRLHVPGRGDCNGDGATDWRDIFPMMLEASDGGPHPTVTAQDGELAGSWGCDANADGMIDPSDLRALNAMLAGKRRAVR